MSHTVSWVGARIWLPHVSTLEIHMQLDQNKAPCEFTT